MKRYMPLLLLVLLLGATVTSLAQTREDKMVVVRIDDDALSVIKTVAKQLDFKVTFDEAVKQPPKKVNITSIKTALEDLLQKVLTDYSLRACWTGDKEITVYPDTEEKRDRYSVYVQWKPDNN